MKNGNAFKVKADLKIVELLQDLIPKTINEYKVCHFDLIDTNNQAVAIIGNELSSIEYSISK